MGLKPLERRLYVEYANLRIGQKQESTMLVLEFKAYGKSKQFGAVDEVLRTVQFIRNKALRFWMDGLGKTQYDLF